MRKLISIATIAALFAGVALVADADAGSKYKYKYKYESKYKYGNNFAPAYPKVKFKMPFGGKFVAPAPMFVPAPIVAPVCPPPVVPAFTFAYEQVWIEPVYQQVVSGYDHCGNPIYQTVMTSAGYYRTAKYQVFPSGRRVFVCYV